jgi:imidazolonepropionase-like amidohydrolase
MNGGYVLRGANVLDAGHEFAEDTDLLISDGLIGDVGRGLHAPGVPSLDAQGLWVLPGLIDCHVHLTMSSIAPYDAMRRPITLWALEAAAVAARTLRSGVTFARDADGAEAGLRTALRTGLIDGPQLQISILMLSATGGHADGFLHGPGLEASAWYQTPDYLGRPSPLVDGVDDMRRRVRELVRAGADWIKLCATGGLASEFDEPDGPDLAADEILEAVTEAGRHGRSVMAHCYGGAGLDHAVRSGVRSIEHGALVTEEQCAAMARRGCWLVPTRSALLDDVDQARAQRFSPAVNDKTMRLAPALDEYVAMARAAGVRIATGTDAIEARRQARIVDELRALRQAGLSTTEVLAAATSEAAELCGVAHQTGRIARGLRADLVVVDREPGLDGDFSELDPPAGVVLAGRAIRLPEQLRS